MRFGIYILYKHMVIKYLGNNRYAAASAYTKRGAALLLFFGIGMIFSGRAKQSIRARVQHRKRHIKNH